MKPNKIITAAIAAAVLGGITAQAQSSFSNGDMFAAFGNNGSTDVIVDLGSISSFQNGTATGTYDLSSVITSTFGSVSGSIYWAVFGGNDASSTVWNTLKRTNPANQTSAPAVAGNAALQALAVGDIATIAGLTDPNSAGPGLISIFSAGVALVDTSLGGFSPMMNNPFNGNLQGDWTYNILNNGAGVSDLYESAPGSHILNHGTYLGNFALNNSGVLSFNPVPEPSTWAMVGSGALALLALRRRN